MEVGRGGRPPLLALDIKSGRQPVERSDLITGITNFKTPHSLVPYSQWPRKMGWGCPSPIPFTPTILRLIFLSQLALGVHVNVL